MPDEKRQQAPQVEVEVPEIVHQNTPTETRKESVEHESIASAPVQQEQASDASFPAQAVQTQAQQQVFEEESQMRRDIERVLEQDLGDLYLSLKPAQRQQFRIEGERTAAKIELLLRGITVKLVEIIKLIREWLLLLPGINNFYLEQEAKIKAEQLMFLKKEKEEEEV